MDKMNKTIKLNFCGFWTGFNPDDNFFTNLLRKYYPVEISEDPDYLFCSVFSNDYIYNEKAVRIFYTGECVTPDFNLVDYAMGFDHLTFGDRYCRVPLYILYGEDYADRVIKRGGQRENPVYREQFCSFVYSNSQADPMREEFFHKLNSRLHVDSGGKYLNNVGGPVKDKYEFEGKHRFSIAFENYSYPGYVTEKVMDSFAAGTIPIYFGDPEIDKTLNPESYICMKNHDDIDKAIDRILEINDDKEKLFYMLSQSPFKDEAHFRRQNDECIAFIKSIFDRPINEAFRRNRGMRGKNYEKILKRYSKADKTLHRVRDALRGRP